MRPACTSTSKWSRRFTGPRRPTTWRRAHSRALSLSGCRGFATGFGIDATFRDLVEIRVRAFLFVEILLQNVSKVVATHFAGPGNKRAVACDLIVFDGLR